MSANKIEKKSGRKEKTGKFCGTDLCGTFRKECTCDFNVDNDLLRESICQEIDAMLERKILLAESEHAWATFCETWPQVFYEAAIYEMFMDYLDKKKKKKK